jgi:hypothetical protein
MIKCWHYRRIISRSADDNTPLPPAAQAHVAQCPDCRRVFESEQEIVRRLSAGAAAQKRQQPPPFLHARIMARIATAPPAARRASKPSLLRRPAALAAACIVLTAILLWPGRPGPKPASVQIAQIQPPQRLGTAAATGLPGTAPLAQWTTNLDQPLETEMQAVMHDARGAMTALADNFFPEKLRQTLLPESASRN